MVRLFREKKSSLEITATKTKSFLDVFRNVHKVRTDGVESSSITSFLRELGGRLHGRDGLPDFSGKNARV